MNAAQRGEQRGRCRGPLAALVLAGLLVLAAAPARADLTAPVRQIIEAAGLRDTQVSVCVVDAQSGAVLAAINADEPMIPASNMKLATTAAALDVLGPDFVFKTQLVLVERDAGGAARLLVRGDGDPALGDPRLLEDEKLNVEELLAWWVRGVKDRGVSAVSELVIDDRAFDRTFVHPSWPEDQLNLWYCAQVAGITFYDNTLDVMPEPTAEDHAPAIKLIPEAPFLQTTNRAVTGKADTFWISRKAGTNELTLWGKVKSRRSEAVPVTIHDPPIFFAQVLSHRLGVAGMPVKVIRRLDYSDESPRGEVVRVVQTPLGLVLNRCNRDSQNLFAECLLKRMGHAMTGAPGSWESGAAAVRQALRQRLGPRSVAFHVADGSGMSRDNRITAAALSELLRSMRNDPRVWPTYRTSLSEGGRHGTLQRRFDEQQFKGVVLGKSGYLNGVSGLSGYLLVPDPDAPGGERTFAFALLFNGFKPPIYNHHIKSVQDQIVTLFDRHYARQATAAAGG